MTRVSVIIPVYNEEDNIAKLHKEVVETCRAADYEFEVIIVDDGSSDRTAEVVKNLSPVKLVRFRKNFGQTAAMDAGIKVAKHEYLITMDGDGQNDPADMPKMIRYLEANQLDVVSGWRKNRRDGFSKKFISRGADWLRKFLLNDKINDSGCSLKVYKKDCFKKLNLYGEMHRFIAEILAIKGFSVGELEVNHRPRIAGKTKYSWQRIIKAFIDMISVWFWSKYAVRPLHLLGGFGLALSLIGFMFATITFAVFLIYHDVSNTAWPILTSLFLIMGVQLFILGLLADISSKNYHESTKNTPYSIKEIIEN